MFSEKTIKEYLKEVASPSPFPGCGSVSAVAAGLGIALSSMVYNLTIGKKFYEEYDGDLKDKIENGLKISSRLFGEYIKLIDEDIAAYENVFKIMTAKENENQKELKQKELEKAYIKAIDVPLKLARLCDEGLVPILLIAQYGNQNAVADAAVGAVLLYAAMQSAVIIVKTNISNITDKKMVEDVLKECDDLLKKYEPIKDEIINISLKGM
ncbi:MAG: cyclodeaminase/cyclohydrolase family protein [Thermoanaerobacteraceae bacterium]|nr:cyclodeaminase/cyclohydrolase family protein [Thermoanaerobacteraceae bacterium]